MGNTQKRGHGIGDKIKHFFVDTIGGGIKRAFNYVKDGVSNVVGTLHDDARDLVKGVNSLVVKTEDTLAGTVKEVNHNMTNLGVAVSGDVKDLGVGVTKNISTMAMPLAFGAAAIAAIMYMRK